MQAQGELLLLRVRLGQLARDRLELACHLGHPPALVALGQEGWQPPGLREWVLELERWGRPVVVRALVAAARVVHPLPDTVARRQLESAQDWCDCPCEEHAESAYQASRANDGKEPSAAYYAALTAHVAGHMSGPSGSSSMLSMAKISLRTVGTACEPEAVRSGIRAALVTWAFA